MRKLNLQLKDRTLNAFSLLIVGAGIFLLLAGTIYFLQQQSQKEAIDRQTESTNQLILQVKDLVNEVKTIGEENRDLNKQNRNYAYCNAVLLAQYTQTRQPIVIEDLNKCVLKSFDSSVSSAPNTSQPAPKTTGTSKPSSGGSQGSSGGQTGGNTPQPPANQIITVPGLLDVKTPCVKLLKILNTCIK